MSSRLTGSHTNFMNLTGSSNEILPNNDFSMKNSQFDLDDYLNSKINSKINFYLYDYSWTPSRLNNRAYMTTITSSGFDRKSSL